MIESHTCPPADFQSKAIFNPTTFFTGTWYSIKQVEVQYQPLDTFFCTTAQYTLKKTKWCKFFGCNKQKVVIRNRGTIGLNGKETKAQLTGLPSKSVASQAKVGPRFLPSFLYGDYWVIEAGTYDELMTDAAFESEDYEWAIISGGAPKVATANGCLPGVGKNNFKGFWMFSRIPEPSAAAIEKISALAKAKGFDTTAWKPVVQKGCTYL